MKKLAMLAALLGTALGFAASASAAAPDVFTVPISDSFADTDTCGPALPITTTLTGTIRFTTFADGNQIRHGDITATLSANRKTVTNNQHFNVFVTDTTRTVVGAVFTINVPGHGVLALDAGRLVLGADGVLFAAGPHGPFYGDVAGLCSYLSN
jgi:hypothetical protein